MEQQLVLTSQEEEVALSDDEDPLLEASIWCDVKHAVDGQVRERAGVSNSLAPAPQGSLLNKNADIMH